MKIRIRKQGGSRRRAVRLLERVVAAGAGAPMAAMEELIHLGQADGGAREEIMAALVALFQIGGHDSFEACWLALVVGELSAAEVPLLLQGLGPSAMLDQAIIDTLTRRAPEVFDSVMERFGTEVAARVAPYRADLYEILQGAVLVGEETVKDRLARFALERVEAEKRYLSPESALGEPLFLLAALGHPETSALVREARLGCARGDEVDLALDDVEKVVRGELDVLERARLILTYDWRMSAMLIEMRFGPRGRAAILER